jgi:hypothetical protein
MELRSEELKELEKEHRRPYSFWSLGFYEVYKQWTKYKKNLSSTQMTGLVRTSEALLSRVLVSLLKHLLLSVVRHWKFDSLGGQYSFPSLSFSFFSLSPLVTGISPF